MKIFRLHKAYSHLNIPLMKWRKLSRSQKFKFFWTKTEQGHHTQRIFKVSLRSKVIKKNKTVVVKKDRQNSVALKDIEDGDWVDIRHLDACEKSKIKEIKVSIRVKIVRVWPYADEEDRRKYCLAKVGDQYGTIDMHVWGSLVDMIKEDKFVTL